MSALVATGHIAGTIFALVVFGVLLLFVTAWEVERNKRRLLEDAAARLGVTVEELDSEAMISRVVEFSAERSSNELLRNRLSDLCGVIRTLWAWLGSALQVVVLLAVIWFTITQSNNNSVYAWLAFAIAVFFWLVSVGFSLACRLLTGRYPGEAKIARRALTDFLRHQRSGVVT
jgi:hypothetical protein